MDGLSCERRTRHAYEVAAAIRNWEQIERGLLTLVSYADPETTR